MITQDYIKSLFTYNDGRLYWNVRKSDRIRIGDEVGTKCSDGRINVKLDGKNYRLHRLIFLYHHGYLPNIIDHIDGNNTNNIIENLRPATVKQNGQNRSKQKNNTSGHKGVYFHKSTQKWVAYCDEDSLGYYDTSDEAAEKVSSYRKMKHGEFSKD